MGKAAASKSRPRAEPSRLQSDLAGRILRRLKDQNADAGLHLVEQDFCDAFGVSRTPIRGALRLLERQGFVAARAHRGFILAEPITDAAIDEPPEPNDQADRRLMSAIAAARGDGALPAECSLQEICRMFGAKSGVAGRVMRRLADEGLAERKAGNGWSFRPLMDARRAQMESDRFRHVVEPAAVLQDTFQLDLDWARKTRLQHMAFRTRPWGNSSADQFLEMNADFHEQLARCSGNRYMHDVVRRQIRLRSFLNFHADSGSAAVFAAIEDHMKILAAVEAGDYRLAADHMIDHLEARAELARV